MSIFQYFISSHFDINIQRLQNLRENWDNVRIAVLKTSSWRQAFSRNVLKFSTRLPFGPFNKHCHSKVCESIPRFLLTSNSYWNPLICHSRLRVNLERRGSVGLLEWFKAISGLLLMYFPFIFGPHRISDIIGVDFTRNSGMEYKFLVNSLNDMRI